MEAIETIEREGVKAMIFPDEVVNDSPRESMENLGNLWIWEDGYTVSYNDNPWTKDPVKEGYFNSLEDVRQYLKDEMDAVVFIDVYIADYGSGGVRVRQYGREHQLKGFLWLSGEQIAHEYGDRSEASVELAKSVLEAEFEVYRAWAEGEVFGYVVEDQEGEVIDSCWGYYGLKDVRSVVEHQADYFERRFQQAKHDLVFALTLTL